MQDRLLQGTIEDMEQYDTIIGEDIHLVWHGTYGGFDIFGIL